MTSVWDSVFYPSRPDTDAFHWPDGWMPLLGTARSVYMLGVSSMGYVELAEYRNIIFRFYSSANLAPGATFPGQPPTINGIQTGRVYYRYVFNVANTTDSTYARARTLVGRLTTTPFTPKASVVVTYWDVKASSTCTSACATLTMQVLLTSDATRTVSARDTPLGLGHPHRAGMGSVERPRCALATNAVVVVFLPRSLSSATACLQYVFLQYISTPGAALGSSGAGFNSVSLAVP